VPLFPFETHSSWSLFGRKKQKGIDEWLPALEFNRAEYLESLEPVLLEEDAPTTAAAKTAAAAAPPMRLGFVDELARYEETQVRIISPTTTQTTRRGRSGSIDAGPPVTI
jgi:hypothetical protein